MRLLGIHGTRSVITIMVTIVIPAPRWPWPGRPDPKALLVYRFLVASSDGALDSIDILFLLREGDQETLEYLLV